MASICSFHFWQARSLGGIAQAMQHAEEDCSFDGELELAVAQQSLDHFLASGLSPQSFEHHGRSDRSRRHLGSFTLAMGGQQQDRLAEPGAGPEQSFRLAAFLQLVQPAQRGDHALLGATVFPAVFDHLQVDATAGLLLAKEHGALLVRDTMILTPCNVAPCPLTHGRGARFLRRWQNSRHEISLLTRIRG